MNLVANEFRIKNGLIVGNTKQMFFNGTTIICTRSPSATVNASLSASGIDILPLLPTLVLNAPQVRKFGIIF